MPVYPLSNDDEIGAALNVARNPDPMGDTIQAKIGGLNQALTGLDLEANTPQFNTGIGGAGMPSAPTRQLNDIGHYSHAAEQASTLQPRGDATQMISTLKNMPGVKPEELQNAGLIDAQGNVHPEWAGRGKITREDLAGHLQSSMPQVQETVLGRIHEFPSKEIQEKYLQEYLTTKENFFRTPYSDPNYEKVAQEFKKAEDNMKVNVPGWGIPESGETTKYGQYTLPGGENYREVVLHLSNKLDDSTLAPLQARMDELVERKKNLETSHTDQLLKDLTEGPISDFDYNDSDRQIRNTEMQISALKKQMIPKPIFQSSHFPQPDVLAHLRMADRAGPNGEKILHVEEIQSDWGQKGKKEGFQQNMTPAEQQEYNNLKSKNSDLFLQLQNAAKNDDNELFDELNKQRRPVLDRIFELDDRQLENQSKIPSAPYVTNTGSWTDLALKRALKEAAEGGYDKLVWTPGAEQAGRYDLSKQISRLVLENNPAGGHSLRAYSPSGDQVINQRIVDADKELPDLVGKEVAKKLLDQDLVNPKVFNENLTKNDISVVPKENRYQISAPWGWSTHVGMGVVNSPEAAAEYGANHFSNLAREANSQMGTSHATEYKNATRTLIGQDLSVGGEGMKEYYDKIVPNQLKKIAKHYDPNAKVGYTDVMLPPSGKAGTNNPPMAAPGLDITPQMREAIMRGQKAFKRGGRTLGNNAIDNALRLATGGRAHFDDGGDAGGDVRGGDNPGGYSADTGRFSGNQDAANNFRMGDSPGGFGGDTGHYSSHDVGAEQGAINAQTARDQQNQQNERQAQQNNPEGYSVRTNDVPGGLGGDTGRYNGPTNQAEAQQNFAAAVLQGNIQRARQQQQQAFDKYMNQIQGPESGGQGSAYNATTGAFGAYQLMPSTALGLMQKYAPGETYRQALGTSNPADVAAGGLNAGPGYVGLTPQEQLRDITLNQDLQRTLAEGLTRDNMATLSSAGVPINSGSLYTAHLLGAGDALKVLQSDPNTPLSQTGINPQAISNNKLEGMTAGQLLARSGSQMAATPASGVSSAGGYGRLAENVTDNSGARITDATASPDAAVTAAKAAATAQQPSIFDKIFGSTQDQIDKLAAQGQYSGMDKQQYADEFANGDPNAVKERIIYDNGQPKVDYYTKDLTQALFGDPLKALQTGISGLFKPSTSDNGFRSSVTQPTDNAAPTYGGHGGQQAINQAIAVAQPQQVAAPAPYIAQLGNYNSQLPSTTGQTAEQWAAANTGGDMSRVNGRIKYVNGAPMLEFYSA